MKMRWSVIVVAVVAAAVGFVFESNGPVGSQIWPMADGLPEPEGANLGLLIVMGVLEAVAFGAGVAFLVFGYPVVKRTVGATGYAVALYLSVAWLLVNWVPHTALHMNHGNILTPADFTGLVGIEYGFHLTLMIAGAIVLSFVYKMARARGATPVAAR